MDFSLTPQDQFSPYHLLGRWTHRVLLDTDSRFGGMSALEPRFRSQQGVAEMPDSEMIATASCNLMALLVANDGKPTKRPPRMRVLPENPDVNHISN